MTLPLVRKKRRPLWMTPAGEGWGDAFMDRLWTEWPRFEGEEWVPALDFFEKDNKYYLTAEMPGINKDDLNITVSNGMVTISGKKEARKEEEGANFYLKESVYGAFSRSLRLPGEVDEGKVEATFKDGLLTVVMPHRKEAKAKRIEVK